MMQMEKTESGVRLMVRGGHNFVAGPFKIRELGLKALL